MTAQRGAATQAQVTEAASIAAQVVARDGADYLPVFLRLEAEIERLAGQNSALERALSAARKVA